MADLPEPSDLPQPSDLPGSSERTHDGRDAGPDHTDGVAAVHARKTGKGSIAKPRIRDPKKAAKDSLNTRAKANKHDIPFVRVVQAFAVKNRIKLPERLLCGERDEHGIRRKGEFNELVGYSGTKSKPFCDSGLAGQTSRMKCFIELLETVNGRLGEERAQVQNLQTLLATMIDSIRESGNKALLSELKEEGRNLDINVVTGDSDVDASDSDVGVNMQTETAEPLVTDGDYRTC